MRILTRYLFLFIGVALLAGACKKEVHEYDVNQQDLQPPNAGKTKLKTNEQYVSILYANLFQTALSSNRLFQITQCIESVGDKELVREVIISNFMNEQEVIIPTDSVMRADVDQYRIHYQDTLCVREMSEADFLKGRHSILENKDLNHSFS